MLNEILNLAINQITPVAATSVAAYLIKKVAPVIISYIRKKEEVVANKIGIDTYNTNLKKAKNVWNEVDEEFRITPALIKTIDAAQAKFAEKILKVIPGLTVDEIDHLRQAVAGEVNKGKGVLTAPIEPAVKVVEPIVKYVTEDGIELQPVSSTTQVTQ